MMPSTSSLVIMGSALLSPAAAALYAVPLSQSLHLPVSLSAFGYHHLRGGHPLLDWASPPSVFDAWSVRSHRQLQRTYRRMLSHFEDTMPRWVASVDGGFAMTLRASPGLQTSELTAELQPDGMTLTLSTPRRRVEVGLPVAVRSASSLSLEHDTSLSTLTLRLAKEKEPDAIKLAVTSVAAEAPPAHAATAEATTAPADTEASALEERAEMAKQEEEALETKFPASSPVAEPVAEMSTAEAPSGEAEGAPSDESPADAADVEAADEAESASGARVLSGSVEDGNEDGSKTAAE